MTDLNGIIQKPIAEMSDEELQEEILKTRNSRRLRIEKKPKKKVVKKKLTKTEQMDLNLSKGL